MVHQDSKSIVRIAPWLAGLFLACTFSTTLSAQTIGPAPDWVSSVEPGTWKAISLNTLSSVNPEKDPSINPNYPSNAPWHGANGQPAVVTAWNGGAFAPSLGQYGSLITYGGGHDAYYGSEVYAFDLQTLKWSRLSNPYRGPFNWPYSTAEYPDKSPLPPHTFDFVDFHPRTNSFVVLKGQNELGPPSNSTAVSVAHMFNVVTKSWRRSPINSDARLYSGGYSVYDPSRDVFWVEGGSSSNCFCKFNPNSQNADGTYGTWTNYPHKLIMTNSVAAYDPVNDLFVVTAFRDSTSVYAIDLKNPSSSKVELVEGGTPPSKSQAHGWEWSPDRRAFLYYSTGADVHEFKLEGSDWRTGKWTWRRLTSSSNSVQPEEMEKPNGVFSRFRVAHYTDGDVAFAYNRTSGPVYAFRIPRGPGTTQPLPPANVTAQ